MGSRYLTVKNVEVLGGRTTIKLEPVFWNMLKEICRSQRTSLNDMIQEIDRLRGDAPRASAIRVFVLEYYCMQQETGEVTLNKDQRSRRYSKLQTPERTRSGEWLS